MFVLLYIRYYLCYKKNIIYNVMECNGFNLIYSVLIVFFFLLWFGDRRFIEKNILYIIINVNFRIVEICIIVVIFFG